MALSSPGSNTDKIAHGSAAGLDNLATGTLLLWLRPSDVANTLRIMAAKQDSAFANGWTLYRPGLDGTQLRFDLSRATVALSIYSVTGTLAANTWYLLGATWNTGGVNADQKLFVGTLTSSVAEPSYGTQQVGSGAAANDSANNLAVLNNDSAGSFSMPGRVAWAGLWNRQLALGEVQAQQFRPHVTSGCILFTHYGYNGTGTQPDWSGNAKSGTVTGATVADHAPIALPYGFATFPYAVGAAPAAVILQRMRALRGVGV